MRSLCIRIAALACMISLLLVALHLLWNQAYRHFLPTDFKSEYSSGDYIPIGEFGITTDRTTYLHFFEMGCLYSRVNLRHITTIMKQYQSTCDFYVVVSGDVSIDDLRDEYAIPNTVRIIDMETKALKRLGVFTTPHALIVEANDRLYFQGNYTLNNGLCGPTNIESSAPATALRFITQNKPSPFFPAQQLNNWGCQF